MARALNEFINILQNKGMRIQNMWEIELITGYSEIDEKMKNVTFYADGFDIPSRTQDTVPVPFKGYELNVPSKMSMTNEHSLKIRCDVNGDLRRTFLKWMNYVTDANIAQGSYFGGEKRIPKNANIRVKLLAGDMETVVETYKLYGCIPLSVGDMSMSNSEAGVVTFDVKIRSQYWEVESAKGEFPEQK